MRTSSLILCLMLVASASSSVWLWRELDRERQHSQALEARGAGPPAPAATAATAATDIVAPPAATLSSSAAPSAVAPVVPASDDSVPRAQGKPEDWAVVQRRLMRDPKYRAVWREQQRLTYGSRRENLVRLIGLTPDQADAVIELQIDREAAWVEKTPSDMPADEAAHQDRLRKLIGEDRRARLQEYMDSRGTRMQVDRLRTELSEVNALRDDQVEPLITALHAERSQFRQEMEEYRATLDWERDSSAWRRFNERQIEKIADMNARMLRAAGSVLSSAQLARLDAMLKRDMERQTASFQMNRIRTKLLDGRTESQPN